jgi:hypothetical protein
MNDPTEGIPSNDTLRQAFAQLSETTPRRPECPPDERLWEAARGGLPPEATKRLADHVASCGACVEAWRLARELAGKEKAVASLRARPSARAASWRRGAWAMAAALVVLAGAALWRTPWRPSPEPTLREGQEVALRSLVPENQPLPRASFLLKWSSAGEGATYDLYVVTEDLQNIASTRGVRTNEFLVPEKSLAALPAGATVIWRVSARLRDGRGITSTSFIQRLE